MDIENFINQQLGTLRWIHCDSLLSRLESRQQEEYKYILPFSDMDNCVESPIFACKFAERQGYEHLLALANEEGKVAIYDAAGRTERIGKNIHHNAIFDVAWQPDCSRIITASGDNTAVLLDVGEADIKIARLFYGHSRSVKTVAFRGKNDPYVFSSGSRDGTIILWDIRAERANSTEFISYPDTMIVNSHLRAHRKGPSATQSRYGLRRSCAGLNSVPVSTISGSDSVTCIAFADQNSLVSCGAGDGVIKIWDMRKTYVVSNRTPTPKLIIPYAGNKARSGYTNLLIDQARMRLYASCLDNIVYCHNLAALGDISDENQDKVVRYTGFQNATFYVKSALSPCGRYMISGSSDQHAYIWNIADAIQQPVLRLRGHLAEVTCVAWTDNAHAPFTIVTCSDDMHHRVWRLGDGARLNERTSRYEPGENDVTGFADILTNSKPAHFRKRLRITSKSMAVNRNSKKHKPCENCGTKKRPADFSIEKDNKRFISDKGPRRLFATLAYNELGIEPLDMITEGAMNLKFFPTNKRKRKHSSDCEMKDVVPFSPTTNLPNFVVDGEAPHLNCSPQKQRDTDWLTKLRTEKQLVKKIKLQGLATTLSQDPYLDISEIRVEDPYLNGKYGSSTATPRTPRVDSFTKKTRRRSSCNTPKTSLYNYFKVTNNGQLSPKSPNQTSQVKLTINHTT